MTANEQLLQVLFASLNKHDHRSIAECYIEDAVFEDIAFRLIGRRQIHAMWDMICSPTSDGQPSDIVAEVKEMQADDSTGRVVVVDNYTFRETGKKVQNRIISEFEFREGRIVKQVDRCDPISWARQAIGGFGGFLAGHIGLIRRLKAMSKLKRARPEAFCNQ